MGALPLLPPGLPPSEMEPAAAAAAREENVPAEDVYLRSSAHVTGYDIQATCGGIALCGTCHIEVLAGPALNEPGDDEMAMLETLPVQKEGSRLSCQIRLTNRLDGLVLRLMPQTT